MKNLSSSAWWWSDPNCQWLPAVNEYIRTSSSLNQDPILLHCEDVTGFEQSISITNYLYNLSLGEERTMFLNVGDMVSSIELFLAQKAKKSRDCGINIVDDEVIQFYDEYISSFDEKLEDSLKDSIISFKEFLSHNNCINIRLLLDFYLKDEKKEVHKHINGQTYLILGSPSSAFLKDLISILSGQKLYSICVETPLDISLQGSPNSQISDKIKVVDELIDVSDIGICEKQLDVGSATQEYAEDIILSFLSLMVNSRNELSLSKAMISPIINLSHEAFTVLKHLSVEKEMPMCQVAVSYVTRIRLGGKGYAPPDDCPMLRHLKGLELFVDTLNHMQMIVEEDSCPRSAIKRLINFLKKKLLKCGSEKLKMSSIETAVESLQSTFSTVYDLLKSRVSSSGSQVCQGSLDILYHFVNFVNCSSFISDPGVIFSKKKAERTPLNLPPLLGYFRSPDEESSCDTKSTLNEDSQLSRNSLIVQSSVVPSYFHHSESSEVSTSCINSTTPSKVTFKGCLQEKEGTSQNTSRKFSDVCEKKSQDSVPPPKKTRKRCILSEITNESDVGNVKDETVKNSKKILQNQTKENVLGPSVKKVPKKEPNKRGAKKFKQIQGQGIVYIYKVIRYQTDKLARSVGGMETTQNHIGMQGRKCCLHVPVNNHFRRSMQVMENFLTTVLQKLMHHSRIKVD